MTITKQQAQQELLRRQSVKVAPVKNTQQSNLQQAAKAELARRELLKRGQMQQKPTGFSGFTQNLKTDFGSYAKGLLGLGREAITHPIKSTKVVTGLGKEIIKGIPGAVQDLGHNISNYGETQRKGIEAWNQLRQIPYAKQKEMLAQNIQSIENSNNGNADQKRLAQIGLGLLGNYSQYSRFKEKAYNEPFSVALDVITLGKGLGADKLISKGVNALGKTKYVAPIVTKVQDAFIPMNKIKRLGYGDVAEDIAKTGANIRKSQAGIIKSTVKKFEKDFKLSKAEKVDFFETIDKGRRIPGYIAKSKNPKVQKAIDWYIKDELPRIQKGAGYKSQPLQEGGSLIQEARKAPVDSKIQVPVYHSTDFEGKLKGGTQFTTDKSLFRGRGKNQIEAYVDIKNPYIKKTPGEVVDYNELRKQGYDGVMNRTGKIVIPFEDNQIKIVGSKAGIEPATSPYRKGGDALPTELQTSNKILPENKTNVKSQLPQEGVNPLIQEASTNAPIENYLHHFFNPTKETKFGSKLSSPQRGYLKQSKDVEGFIKDPVVSIAGVKSKIATSNIKQGFIDRVVKKYAVDNVKEFKNGKVFSEAGEELAKYKGKYLPKDLADEITRIETGEPGWLKTVLSPARAFNRNWKPLATAVRPRYHLRNVIGNVYNASFIGGAKGRRYFQAASQQMKGYIANQMKEGTIAGKVFKSLYKNPPEHKYIKMAIDDDLIGRGFFSVDINDMAEVADTVEDFSKLIAKMDSPAMVYKIPLLKQWMNGMQKFGSTIEDNARLSLYIDQLKRGASRAAAKTYVNKHLFDYLNGLGDADKVIKAVIPFWSWTRFNIPLQFGAMAKNPLRHLIAQEFGKPYVQQNEANNPEYKYLSQREKDMGAIKTGETTKNGKVYDKYMRTQNVLPLQDLMRVPGILSGQQDDLGLSPVFDMVSQARNMVSPPKNLQENLDYYGRPVESFPGEVKRYMGLPVRGTGKEILQSIPLLSEINKLVGGSYDDKSRPALSSRLETVISPTSSTLVDREKNRQYFESDFNRTFGTGTMMPGYLSELKNVAKRIIENPKDSVNVKNFRTLINLMKQGGMTDADIQKEIEKAIQAQLKKESPKEKRPGSLRPQRPSPLLDPYYAEEVKKRASSLTPYYK